MDVIRYGESVGPFLPSAKAYIPDAFNNSIALVHQLALPSPPSLPATAREVRHRLLWACYCIDTALTGDSPDLSGFPTIAALAGIPLPTNERRFLLRQSGNPRPLTFPWVPPSGGSEEGMPAQNVIVFALGQQVVRSVHPHPAGEAIACSSSRLVNQVPRIRVVGHSVGARLPLFSMLP